MALGQTALTPIDRDLASALDFRNNRYSGCFGQSVCTVDGLTVRASRLPSTGGTWGEAQLYWDPVDGFGVLGGGQDDEIDIDESVTIEFDAPTPIHIIWLTDLFVDEGKRYSRQEDEEVLVRAQGDAEVANIDLFNTDQLVRQLEVTGDLALPNLSFNSTLAPELFQTGEDLRKRLVIEDGQVVMLEAVREADANGGNGATVVRLNESSVGTIDPDKVGAFRDIDSPANALDLIEEYSRPLDVEIYPEGSGNARRISELLDDSQVLEDLYLAAEIGRSVGNVPNGEVSAHLGAAVRVNRIVFNVTTRTSND